MSSQTQTKQSKSNFVSRREGIVGWLFALPFTLLFLISFLIPIVISIWKSFFKKQLTMGGLGAAEEVFVGVQNYASVLMGSDFWIGLLNVVEYGIIKIPLVIGSALCLALLLDSLAARGIKFFRLVYFLPYAIPGIIAAILWTYLYSPNLTPFGWFTDAVGVSKSFFISPGLLNASMANITAWTFIGYNMIIFIATLKSIPSELYEAARIDGASEFQIVRKIKLPMLKNAALMTVLMSIVGTVQWFNEPTIMRTLVPAIDSNYTPMMMAYSQGFGANNLGAAAAISVLMAVVAGILAGIYAWVQLRISK